MRRIERAVERLESLAAADRERFLAVYQQDADALEEGDGELSSLIDRYASDLALVEQDGLSKAAEQLGDALDRYDVDAVEEAVQDAYAEAAAEKEQRPVDAYTMRVFIGSLLVEYLDEL